MKKLLIILLLIPLFAYSQGLETGQSKIGGNVGLKIPRVTHSPQALAYVARMTVQPSADTLNYIMEFIDSLVSNGVYAKLDEFWITANNNETNAMLGVKNYKNLTKVVSPVFEAYKGVYGVSGNGSCYSTNFNPATDGVNFTQNSSSFGVYVRNGDLSGQIVGMGGTDGTDRTEMFLYYSGGLNNIYASSSGTSLNVFTPSTIWGLHTVIRSASNKIEVWRDSTLKGNPTNNSTGLTGVPLYLNGWNNNGGGASYVSTRQSCFAFVGGALTAQNMRDLFSVLEKFLNKIGAGVIANLNKSNTVRIVCDGNSLTASNPGYPSKLQDTLGTVSYNVVNTGVAGQTWYGMLNNYPTTLTFNDTGYSKQVLVFWEGTNTMNSYSADTCIAVMTRYGTLAKAGGWNKVIVMTTLPFGTDEAKNTRRDSVNTWLKANYSSVADTIIDLCANTNIGDWGDNQDVTYYSDGTHLTQLGYALVRNMVYVALKNLKVIS